ncbi:MAG: hypothetical protein FWE49_03830 [Synergistaceae bacterium]|nr:hypothetical protein [Synergistaceae bacterium]
MNFLDKVFGRTELMNRIESLQKALQCCQQIREEEKKEFESMYMELEGKLKRAETKYIESMEVERKRIKAFYENIFYEKAKLRNMTYAI